MTKSALTVMSISPLKPNLGQHSRRHHHSRKSMGLTERVFQMLKAGESPNSRVNKGHNGVKQPAGHGPLITARVGQISPSQNYKIPFVILGKIRLEIL